MIEARCPICDRPLRPSGGTANAADWPEFPFCSSRCRLIDLGRWLGEAYRYRVPVEDEEGQAPSEGSAPETDIP
jgi:endogenous inhibitor of DNA gyrase (YacG/DUF329 family)